MGDREVRWKGSVHTAKNCGKNPNFKKINVNTSIVMGKTDYLI